MAERAAERVARAEAVEDPGLDGRHRELIPRGARVHAFVPAFHDRQRRAKTEQRRGGRTRFLKAGRHLDLLGVADHHGRSSHRLEGPTARLVEAPPQMVSIVEVVDGVIAPTPRVERRQRRAAARLIR